MTLRKDWNDNLLTFFLRKIFVVEEDEVEGTAGDAAVGEVEDGAEEGLRMIHPREFVVKEREVEHVYHLSEHEGKRSTRHDGLGPDKAIEEAVDDVAQSAGGNHGQTYQNSGWR